MVKVGLLGSGKQGAIMARALRDGKIPDCELVGIFGTEPEQVSILARECRCKACRSLEELLDLKPDYILEATIASALKEYAVPCLCAGSNVIALSVGAFRDEDFHNAVEAAARANGTKLYLATGVLGGLDIAGAASLAGSLTGTMIRYGYASRPSLLPEDFTGSVRDAYDACPQFLNVVIAAGLACGSLDRTMMRQDMVPEEEPTGFGLELEGNFGSAKIKYQFPKNAGVELPAWSALAALKRAISPVVY